MEFVYGMICGVFICGLGLIVGYNLRPKEEPKKEELTQEEEERIKRQEEQWNALMTYSGRPRE